MNKAQKICLWCGLSLVVLVGLFPPWMETLERRDFRISRLMSHHSLFSPPLPSEKNRTVTVDYSRLCLVWALIAGVTGGLVVSLRRWKSREKFWSPWPDVARWLYTWYILGWLILAFDCLRAVGALASIPGGATGELRLWAGIQFAGLGLVALIQFFAQMNIPSRPAEGMRLFIQASLAQAVLGGIGVVAGVMLKNTDVALANLVWAVGSAVFAIFVNLTKPELFSWFNDLYGCLLRIGVPQSFFFRKIVDPGQPHVIPPNEPLIKTRPVRLLRGITTKRIVIPADTRYAVADVA